MKPVAWAVPTWFTTPTEVLAKAMANRAMGLSKPDGDVRIDNVGIFNWAESDGKSNANAKSEL